MASFIRILENSGLGSFNMLIENMSRQQAEQIFSFHGVPGAASLDPATLASEWKTLVKKNHPDAGGDGEAMKEINAAYDTLKNGGVNGRAKYSGTGTRYEPREPEGDTTWVMAGHSGGVPPSPRIYRNDYRDVNFIKKRMWELSGKSREEWTIIAWDGNFFRSITTVYGSPAIFHEMAEAMVVWNSQGGNPYRTEAVFAYRRKSRELHLIYFDGEFFDGSITFEHDSFNSNPGNDKSFCQGLNDQLRRATSSQMELPLAEGDLYEFKSERTTTHVLYYLGPDGWHPHGVIHDGGPGNDLDRYIESRFQTRLTQEQRDSLHIGEAITIRRGGGPRQGTETTLAMRTFEAVLPR